MPANLDYRRDIIKLIFTRIYKEPEVREQIKEEAQKLTFPDQSTMCSKFFGQQEIKVAVH